MKSGFSIAINGQIDKELANVASVKVYERQGEATTFNLKYDIDIEEKDFPFLKDERIGAGSEVSLLVSLGNEVHCLVKGPVHSQNIHFEHGGQGSLVEVKGSDNSIKMDRLTRSVVWSDVIDSDAVQSIISNYGMTSDVEPTNAGHFENKHALVQRESDSGFIRRLARRNGFLFWITANELGNETAHFKRPQLDIVSDGTLIINLDNILSLDIEWDVERPLNIQGLQLDLVNKSNIEIVIDQTPQPILGENGLKDIISENNSIHLSAPVDDAGDLQARGEAASIESDWFINGYCETTLEKTGFLIRPMSVVTLKGTGSRHSGKYYVAGVRHTINSIEHKMEIEILRNGWGG